MSRVTVLNVYVDNLRKEEALKTICDMVKKKEPAYVVTPNLDHLVLVEKDEEFAKVYQNADLILTDGKPLMWIAKWKGTPIQEKISGSDLFPLLAEQAAEKGYSMFLLGAAEGVAQKAADRLVERCPDLNIAGVYSPMIGFEQRKEEIEHIVQKVRNAHPDILVVALGSPKQEKFIYHYYKQLGVPVSLGLGASVDFVAGTVKRAPRWMSEHGLEWLYRTVQEPGRLAKRYLKDAICMIPLLWKYR